MAEYFVLIREYADGFTGQKAATVYVKEGEFFRSQGGLTEDWGKAWKAIDAESVDDARRKGHASVGSNPPPWITHPKPDSFYEDRP